jgi:class 3 adenylate cyclase
MQQAIQQHNSSSFTEREKLQIRIAISTGEVVLDAGDVFGDTVNLASRVQQIAGPGEVLFTESTHATIKRAEVSCEPAGEFELKGIPGKVRLFRATGVPAVST